MISYNLYWVAVITGFALLRYSEVRGHLPLMKAKAKKDGQGQAFGEDLSSSSSADAGRQAVSDVEKAVPVQERGIEA